MDCNEKPIGEGIKKCPVPKTKRKIHRNDACPCGSTLKYKKCCLKYVNLKQD